MGPRHKRELTHVFTSCTRKKQYTSESADKRIAFKAKRGIQLRKYKCHHCDYYHLTGWEVKDYVEREETCQESVQHLQLE